MHSRRPHYLPTDSLHSFHRAGGFYLQLSNKGILARLKALRASASGYEKYLPHYPDVLCAPLDDLYLFRRASCTLDGALLQDLLFSYSWREANWGAWLAALAPSGAYVEHLQNAKPMHPHGTVVNELAVASCTLSDEPTELAEHWSLLRDIRSLLTRIPRASTPLRIGPTVEQQEAMNTEMEAVRNAYRQGGAEAAKRSMNQKLLSYFFRSHLEWVVSKEWFFRVPCG